ncbi:MAG TPA: peptidyl-prolyl cis-trans isomerase [Myxococcales bacterium]|jgi:peptidyl-prolyl cis-trans isomerase C
MNLKPSLFSCGALAALSLAACHKGNTAQEQKTGPVVATVGNEVITADDVKRRIEETSPFLRARYTTIERKKEFVETLIRNELLAQEAEKQGLQNSPNVKEQMKRAMIQELIKKQLDEKQNGADIAEADLKQFYDTHLDDFQKPERARVFHIYLPAKDAKERSAARAKAAALLKDIGQREKRGEANAFQTSAMRESKDTKSAPMGGDLRFVSKDELTKQYNSALADAAFNLKNPGETSGVVDTPDGVELIKLQVKTVALNRSFDESRDSIRGRLARERRSHEYEEWLKKLRSESKVTLNEDELAKVSIEGAAGPAGQPAMSLSRPGVAPMPNSAAMKPATAPQAPSTASSKIGGQ